MALDFKQTTANTMLNTFDTLFPATAILEIRTGAPAGAEGAAGGSLLWSGTLAAAPWLAAALGVKDIDANLGPTAATGDGDAGHFRLKNAGDSERVEGTVTLTGDGGDIEIDNVNIATGQNVTVTSAAFTLV